MLRYSLVSTERRKCCLGAVLCAFAAVVLSMVFQGSATSEFVPFMFLAVIIAVGVWLGALAGVLGTVAAGVVFAVFLFAPLGSLAVADVDERANLAWMLLGGATIAWLFGSRPPGDTDHQARRS